MALALLTRYRKSKLGTTLTKAMVCYRKSMDNHTVHPGLYNKVSKNEKSVW